ncbi:MAG: glutamate--tRNA ligase [Anaerolineae bacterium]|jgi:glutamyl-tRNA synthetase|nr:glutamate--tRNA ligase [Anaerolineae bacterium]MDH7474606.1 glutamate--tRNA ligase [Anaerolineae bacterium]
MTDKPVRVRFAPSPTGYLHVGGARTALYNWLFARHHGGTFILRIEDTDRTRYDAKALEDIFDSLRWLGLYWDEGPQVGGAYGPYAQSERLAIYQKYARQLVDEGHAYYCYCSPERLAQMREQHDRGGQTGYDRHCRYLTAKQRADYEAQGIVPVVRLKVPLEGQTTFYDVIRGQTTVDNTTLDDLVLLKSDGFPTYHLANVVDDHLMEITHIMRGDEWLPSVPRHVLIYQAFGWEIPIYAHLPIILSPTGKGKLSKRHGGVEVRYFRERGYLPEAMVNFLARVGWSYDDKTELFTREELIAHFDLNGVNKSPAAFSYEKLEWMNGVYIRNLPADDLVQRLVPFLATGLGIEENELRKRRELRELVPLVQERLKTLADITDWADFFFVEEITYDPRLLIAKKTTPADCVFALDRTLELLASLPDFSEEAMETALRGLADDLNMNPGQLFGIIRVAVTGKTVTPPLFGTLRILGRERVLSRLARAREVVLQLAA